jgi:hypothetical protein
VPNDDWSEQWKRHEQAASGSEAAQDRGTMPEMYLGERCKLTRSRPKHFYLGAKWRFIQ